ncbi:MAG: glycosyltransferase family 87 protein [Verrucomicrobiales bacterium]|nr:glycosyltransferase family 87 protein [Verrucomicrobiales bacterium]
MAENLKLRPTALVPSILSETTTPMFSTVRRHHLTLGLAILLMLGGFAYLGKGLNVAWQAGDSDFKYRAQEYAEFERQAYPNLRLHQVYDTMPKAHTVYPPYALPMFAIFFGTGNFETARALLQILSLAALLAMMHQGTRILSEQGWQAGFLGAALAVAISGNCSALALGHFSIIAMGLIALQVLMLQRDKPGLAGICWAFAMIKPQIALPFALLFILRRQWRGLGLGLGLLAALSLGAFWWTGVSPTDFGEVAPTAGNLRFVKDTNYSAGIWISALGINPKTATFISLILLAGIAILLILFDLRKRLDLADAAGVSSMLGFVLFYHRQYDHMMLFPLILVMVSSMFRNGWRIQDFGTTGILALTLYLPASLTDRSDTLSALAFFAPIAAVFLLLRNCFWGEGR